MLNGFLASIFGERINSTQLEKKSDCHVENLKNNSVNKRSDPDGWTHKLTS